MKEKGLKRNPVFFLGIKMILELLGLLALSLLLGNAYLYFYTNSNGQKLNGYAAGQAEEWERSIHLLREKDSEFERKILEQEEGISRKMGDFGKSDCHWQCSAGRNQFDGCRQDRKA
jgi:hypothetical protein